MKTSAGDRIILTMVGFNWWTLSIDTGDYERIIDLTDNDLEQLAELFGGSI